MKLFTSFFCLILISTIVRGQTDDRNYGVIPAPKTITAGDGTFLLDAGVTLVYHQADDKKSAELFRDLVEEKQGVKLLVQKASAASGAKIIEFKSVNAAEKEEAYRLDVQTRKITLTGTAQGVFYATQSLSQLYLYNRKTGQIPVLHIEDEPRFHYRGLHLDVCRHFFSIDFIKKYLDMMAFYKLNTFHWHLTDDQGWRLEIKKYPKLIETGSKRAQTLIGNYHEFMPQRFDGKPYGGYYTQEEAREIVAYAAERHITVIPEIEMPGHASAALTAYPELGCGNNPGPYKVEDRWGVFPDIFCAGKDHTFEFLENVLTEVIAIFPSKYIHIGGDEAPKKKWKTCPFCQKRIKGQGLKNEDQLQSYFIHRIEKFVNAQGRSIIGWDEILDGGLAPNATVMSWRGVSGGIAAAKQNHEVIMTPSTNGLYLDHIQGRSDQEPVSIGGDGNIEKIYAYDPIPAELSDAQKQFVKGVQGNMWTEYITTTDHVEYMLFPRLFALSEIAWSEPEKKSYKSFAAQRVGPHLAWLEEDGTLFRVPEALGAKDTTINVKGSHTFSWMPSVQGAKIYYTINGREPGRTTSLYQEPFSVNVPLGEKRTVRSKVITSSGLESPVVTTILSNMPYSAAANPPHQVQQGGLKYYYVPGSFNTVFEIDTNLATQKGIAKEISSSLVENKAREYGMVFTGYINVNETAEFEFSSYTDDGSRLWIDKQLLIDNDGRHARYERAAAIRLEPGLHQFEFYYFDNGPGSMLKVSVKGTDGKKIELPAVMMFN